MVHVRSRKFCCCLPVRFGVIVIGILGLLGGGLVTVAGIIQAGRTSGSKAALVVQIIIYGLLAILSIFGLIGAIAKRRKLVSAYFTMLTAHLAFSVSSGAFSLFRLFRDAPDTIDKCIDGSDSDLVIKACEKGTSVMKGVMVALFIVVWLIEIWGCVIVNDYNKQLAEEDDANFKSMDAESSRPQW